MTKEIIIKKLIDTFGGEAIEILNQANREWLSIVDFQSEVDTKWKSSAEYTLQDGIQNELPHIQRKLNLGWPWPSLKCVVKRAQNWSETSKRYDIIIKANNRTMKMADGHNIRKLVSDIARDILKDSSIQFNVNIEAV